PAAAAECHRQLRQDRPASASAYRVDQLRPGRGDPVRWLVGRALRLLQGTTRSEGAQRRQEVAGADPPSARSNGTYTPKSHDPHSRRSNGTYALIRGDPSLTLRVCEETTPQTRSVSEGEGTTPQTRSVSEDMEHAT